MAKAHMRLNKFYQAIERREQRDTTAGLKKMFKTKSIVKKTRTVVKRTQKKQSSWMTPAILEYIDKKATLIVEQYNAFMVEFNQKCQMLALAYEYPVEEEQPTIEQNVVTVQEE